MSTGELDCPSAIHEFPQRYDPDPTGALVPNATVAVRNVGTGVESTSPTDSAGAYLFPSLPIGTYRIEVTATGFRKGVIGELKLPVATAITKDIQLEVGQITQQVEINADASVAETATTSLGQVITDKTVQDIPLNGRHFTDLSLLTVGTVTPPANGFLSAPLRGQGSFGINTAGQREDTTNWLVNGINLNDPVQNQITFQPPIDTLAEAKIDNSAFPAQYGRNSGAVVNMRRAPARMITTARFLNFSETMPSMPEISSIQQSARRARLLLKRLSSATNSELTSVDRS